MIARAFYGLFWAYVCLEVTVMLGGLMVFLLGRADFLLLFSYSISFIYIFITYCIFRIRNIDPNFNSAFWFTSINCALSLSDLIIDESVYSSAWITNTIGALDSILSCLMIWFLCDGIYSLAKQSNITSLITKANYRKYLYVISESIFMIWWLYFNYIMSHDPAEIQNKLPLIMSALAIYPVMILHIISVLLLVLLFRQTAKEL